MLIYTTEGSTIVRPLTAMPDADTLREAVGGYEIGLIKDWVSMEYGGKRYACVAFLPIGGASRGLPINERATLEWQRNLRRSFGVEAANDHSLVGQIVVIFGDNQLMEKFDGEK
jgi:hypothetical protein